jgi:hypothetical protein
MNAQDIYISKKFYKSSLILTLKLNLNLKLKLNLNKTFFTLDDNWAAEGVSFLVCTLIDDELIITNVFTIEELRGNGYASILLANVITEAKNLKCKYIKLTDCSDNFMCVNNLYLKHNFTYDESGMPEMTFKL